MSLPCPDPTFYARHFHPLCRLLGRYHRFSTRGLEHIPASGPALIVGSHSAITYDMFLGMDAVWQHTGRIVRGLADRFWYRNATLGDWVTRVGGVEARPDAAAELLQAGELVAVAPGGMFEALRPHTQRFQLRWAERRGFVRLALATGAPVILATCPASDMAVTLYDNALTRLGYRHYGLPLMIGRGLGLSPIPRPVALTYHFHPPIDPGPAGEPTEARLQGLHAFLGAKMEAFMAECVAADVRSVRLTSGART